MIVCCELCENRLKSGIGSKFVAASSVFTAEAVLLAVCPCMDPDSRACTTERKTLLA